MASAFDRAPSTAQIVSWAAEMLRHAGIETARIDAEVLLAEACNESRAWLVTRTAAPNEEQMARFREMLSRRARREPVAHIIGRREFYSLDFEVNPDVLIPRPETEILVDEALKFLSGRPSGRVLDIGAGSGAISIAIAAHAPLVSMVATDISADALAVARRNAGRLGCGGRIEFIAVDLFPESAAPFDLIVSNPPYIPDSAIDALDPEVWFYEPRHALDGGEDGLAFYRRIAAGARAYLAAGGAVMVEIGAGQAPEVEGLFRSAGFCTIDTVRDLAGIERVVRAQG